MTRRVLIHPTVWALIFAASAAAQDVAARADEYVSAWLKQGRFTGSVLLAKDGRVLLSKGYGLANAEHDIPNRPDTKFRLGSITKQFTAAAILQLQEQGKLKVGDPISKFVPSSPEAWKDVTIHHLLTHTSGIPSYTSMPEYRKKMRELHAPLEFISRFRDKPLEFELGSRFRYNNSGYFLLGVIIEQASGLKYEEYLKRYIFDKLDMKDSGYDGDTTILKNRASGYALSGDRLVNAQYLDMSQPYAAGSLYSTVEDLYRWDRALYTEKVLTKTSLEAAFTPFKDNYAYGWAIETAGGQKIIGHGGGINGFSTVIRRAPGANFCVVVLANLEAGAAVARMGRELTSLLLGEDIKLPAGK